MLEAARPARVLDVGDDGLVFAGSAGATVEAWGGTVLSMPQTGGPRPADNVQLLAPYGPQTIVDAGATELAILHGDPNWWTTTWQLGAVASAAEHAGTALPPIVIANAGAPWVLTAIEDFLRERGPVLDLLVVPGPGGAAIITPPAAQLPMSGAVQELLAELRLTPAVRAILEAVTEDRTGHVHGADSQARPTTGGPAAYEELRDELDALRARVGQLGDRLAAERTRAERAELRLRRRASAPRIDPRMTDGPRLLSHSAGELADEPSGQLIRDILAPGRLLDALGWPGSDSELALPIPVDLRGIIDPAAQRSLIVIAGDEPLALRRTLRSIVDRAREPVAVEIALQPPASPNVRQLLTAISRAVPTISLAEARRIQPRTGAQRLSAGQELAPGWPDPEVAVRTAPVAYLLPGMPAEGSGGAKSVVQEARGLRELGTSAHVCVPTGALPRAGRLYGNDDELFVAYAQDSAIGQAVGEAAVAVATEHTSVPLLARLADQRPELALAYYVQDYEPLFAALGSARSDRALLSYRAIPAATLLAKTHFVCNVVEALHGVPVVKVAPSLDRAVFRADGDRERDRPFAVTAMVRPRTPRRRPRTTLAALAMVHRALGERVEIFTFGCDEDELAEVEGRQPHHVTHLGRLETHAVAEQLRRSDVFLDGSAYQAFGRTGLEAMACGAVPVMPALGGAREFAVDGENAILFDDDRPDALAAHVIALAEDEPRLRQLQDAAIGSAAGYSIERAARSQRDLYATLLTSPSAAPGQR